MTSDLQIIQNCDASRFMERLKAIFTDMDREYSRAAEHYGFDCNACTDLCCQTRFYHHTYIEYLAFLVDLNQNRREQLCDFQIQYQDLVILMYQISF